VYVLEHNLVESSMLAANTLVPLMLSIAAGMLVRESITASAKRALTPRDTHPQSLQT
jgi:hypothetical protein